MELKAPRGSDIGIQIDIFGNYFIYFSTPRYETFGGLTDVRNKNMETIRKNGINAGSYEEDIICVLT